MSNVFKQFLGQIARPSQSILYNQNDVIQHVLHQVFSHQPTQSQQASPSIQVIQSQPHGPLQSHAAYVSQDNFKIMNNQKSEIPQVIPFKVKNKPMWMQREYFAMDKNEFQDWSMIASEEDLFGQPINKDIQSQDSTVLHSSYAMKEVSQYPFSKEGYLHNSPKTNSLENCALPEILEGKDHSLFNFNYLDHIQQTSHTTLSDINQQSYQTSINEQNLAYAYADYNSEAVGETNDELEYEDFTIKRPKRNFNSKEEQSRYIEGFRTKYKTEMCKNWELTGFCFFEESCSFAHGPQELNSKTNIPKNYKTKLCKRFHEDLYCPYGSRCQFRHKEDPVAPNPQVPSYSQQSPTKRPKTLYKSVSNVSTTVRKPLDQVSEQGLLMCDIIGKSVKKANIAQEMEMSPPLVQPQVKSAITINEVNDQLQKTLQDTLKTELNAETSQKSRKRLQIFEKITLTKTNKKKVKKTQRLGSQ